MKSKAIQSYKRMSGESQHAIDAMMLCYQRILDASVQHDAVAIDNGISLLEESLQYDPNPKLALHLLSIYQYLRVAVQKELFEEVARVVQGLAAIWERAIELDKLPDIREENWESENTAAQES